MAEPSEKSPAIEAFLEKAWGRTTAIRNDVCANCGMPATEFRNPASEKEYSISGFCQECQDLFFGKD